MTTHVIYGAGTWGTFANAFFTLSGIFGDLLIIRFCLCFAYLFLLISASLGFPAPPYWGFTGVVAIGAIVWSAINLTLQVWAFAALCWDERPVTFKNEDEEQLWRFMLRRAGMHRVDFLQVLQRGSFKRIQAGDSILDLEHDDVSLFLMIEGVAQWTRDDTKPGEGLTFCSGELFDLALFNLFGVHVGFSGPVLTKVVAKTDCLVFSWPIKSVLEMANGKASFAVAGYMRNLALYSIAAEYNRRVVLERQVDAEHSGVYISTGDPEAAEWLQGARSLDFTAPLRPDERKPTPMKRFCALMSRSFALRPPPGIRHDNMPASGALARNRTLVMAQFVEAPRVRKRDVVAASFASMRRTRNNSSSSHKHPESNSSQGALETVRDGEHV